MKKVLVLAALVLNCALALAQTAEDLYHKGRNLEQSKKIEEAQKAYKQSADLGYAPAQFRYGFLEWAKCDCKCEVAEAYMKKAAVQGYVAAMDWLGNYYGYLWIVNDYNYDYSIKEDKYLKEARKHYWRNAKKGQIPDGVFYTKLMGFGSLISDFKKYPNMLNARQLYEFALFSDKRNMKLCSPVTTYTMIPIPNKMTSPEYAVKYYNQLLDSGLYYVNENLGDIYFKGRSIKGKEVIAADLEKAAYYYKRNFTAYKKIADNGNMVAQKRIGDFYALGKGVAANPNEAFKWYMKSAKQGYALAQKYVADCYYNGLGVKKDYAKAKSWCEKAITRCEQPSYLSYADIMDDLLRDFRSSYDYYDDYTNYPYIIQHSAYTEVSDYTYFCSRLSTDSYGLIGKMYEDGGNGLRQNNDLALKNYEKARWTDSYNALNRKLHPELKAKYDAEQAALKAQREQELQNSPSSLELLVTLTGQVAELHNTFKNWDWNSTSDNANQYSYSNSGSNGTSANSTITEEERQRREQAIREIDDQHSKRKSELQKDLAENQCRLCKGSGNCNKCWGDGKCPDCESDYFIDGHGKKIGADQYHWKSDIERDFCNACNGTTKDKNGSCQHCREIIKGPDGHKYGMGTTYWGGRCTLCKGSMKCPYCKGTGKCQSHVHNR